MNLHTIFTRLIGAILLIGPLVVSASELAVRLQSNQYVLLMRHALAPGYGDPAGYSLQRCETQRTLNAVGKAQAERIGVWLRQQGVIRAQIHSSIWCRCQQTAERLRLGPVTVSPALASFFDEPHLAADRNRALQDLISATLQSKGDAALILVTHHVNIREFMGRDIDSGDMVLVRVSPEGQMLDHVLYRSP